MAPMVMYVRWDSSDHSRTRYPGSRCRPAPRYNIYDIETRWRKIKVGTYCGRTETVSTLDSPKQTALSVHYCISSSSVIAIYDTMEYSPGRCVPRAYILTLFHFHLTLSVQIHMSYHIICIILRLLATKKTKYLRLRQEKARKDKKKSERTTKS